MSITMNDLLKVENIVLTISSVLNTNDYLSFQSTTKHLLKTIFFPENDSKYWVRKLNFLGLTQLSDSISSTKSLTQHDTEDDIIVIFEKIKTFHQYNSKTTYIKFHKCFQSFITKLNDSSLSSFFPKNIEDPITQAHILNNISRFHNSNRNDWMYYNKINEKLNIFKEIFINTVLQELETGFQKKETELVRKFIKVLLILKQENLAVDFFKSKNDFITEVDLSSDIILFQNTNEIDLVALSSVLDIFRKFLNEKIDIVDTLFGDEYPVIVSYVETVIEENIVPFFNEQIEEKPNGECKLSKIDALPQIYNTILSEFVERLNKSKNAGLSFHKVIVEFFNLYFEPKILLYLDIQLQKFEKSIQSKCLKYKDEATIREKEQNEQIYNSLKKQTDNQEFIDKKNNFLTSFTKVFKINNNSRSSVDEKLKIAYSLNMITNNLQNIKNVISLDLCYNIVQDCKTIMEQFGTFITITNISYIVKNKCQAIFKTLIFQLNSQHIKPGFDKAINLLKQYNPNEIQSIQIEFEYIETHVEPLVKFIELISIGDIILQMISIFYKNELIDKQIIDNKDFLNDIVQTKRNFETALDDFVADGLNIGINKLMDEVLFVFNSLQLPDDFNPDKSDASLREIKPSKCAIKIIELLSNHCFLLTDATDKGTIDVFQQEVGERFFNEVVKNIKKNLISEDGAIFLICDLNYYYDFIVNQLKQKNIVPYFAGLKSIGQIYLVSGKDSKELGKMICDVNKFHGIFTQEEIYEFVQRRTDWIRVRRDVEKVMYGLGVTDCCIV